MATNVQKIKGRVAAQLQGPCAKSNRANRLHLDTRKKTSSVEHCYSHPSTSPMHRTWSGIKVPVMSKRRR